MSNNVTKEVIVSNNAPDAIGPYSQAIKSGDMIFVSGQIGLVKATGDFISNDIKEQTEQVIKNIESILKEKGYSLEDVVKTSVFLQDINDFTAMNEVYAKYFTKPYPARSAFQVAALPKGARVEIEVIAKN